MSTDKKEPAALPDPICGWLKLWSKYGVQVTFPLRGDITTYAAQIDYLFGTGFLTQCPGMEEGEEKEDIGWVCRIDHENERGVTPTVLLYSSTEQLTYSYLRKYLNTDADIKDFEFACKVRLNDLPIYPGNDHPQRGKSAKTDRFIVALGKPTTLIWKHNPRYRDAPQGDDNRKTAEKTKRLFVRWADTKPADTPKPDDGKPDAVVLAEIDVRLAADPTVASVNDDLLPWLRKQGRPTALAGFDKIRHKLEAHGVLWNAERKMFLEAVKPNNETFSEFS